MKKKVKNKLKKKPARIKIKKKTGPKVLKTPEPNARSADNETSIDIEIRNLLKQESTRQFLEGLKEKQINWITTNSWFDSFEKIKGFSKKVWNHKQEAESNTKLFLLAHDKNILIGKPQLIENSQKTIPLVRKTIRREKKRVPIDIQSFYFLDESFDKRRDGFQKEAFALDFWLYRVMSTDGKEYYLYSQEKLPNATCTFKGMLVEIDDIAELSRSLKVKSVSKIFFVKSFEADVRILSPEEIIKYTKEKEITIEDWLEYLALHPFGTLNRFPEEVELLKSAWLLSGKYQGYPLHLAIIGPAGTKKSCGYIEATAFKFSDNPDICEGGNSRLKGLVPSFKERPADIGYILKQDRVAFVDELGKMVNYELSFENRGSSDVLGVLNAILDCKERAALSGNSSVSIKGTAKNLFVMNPLPNCPHIYSHVGRKINTTTMTRCLWWVQDIAEQEFCFSEKAIVSADTYRSMQEEKNIKNNKDLDVNIVNNRYAYIYKCLRKVSKKEEFLTLFDTTNAFICNMDMQKVREIYEKITSSTKAQMLNVWKPRGEHHTVLLIDGLCKGRCLFKDYDSSFTAKEEDYHLAERILLRMVKGWDTDLSIQEGAA